MRTLQDGLLRGAPGDYSSYCGLVGEIRGIRFAIQQLVEARERVGAVDGDEA